MKKCSGIFSFLIVILILASCTNTDDVGEIYEIKMSRAIFPSDIDGKKMEFNMKDWKKAKKIEDEEDLYEKREEGWEKLFYFHLALEDDKIMLVAPWDENFTFEVENGYFESNFDGGYGGKLNFIQNDGTEYTIIESSGPLMTRYMFSINKKIYLVVGAGQLVPDGAMYMMKNTDGIWATGRRIDLYGFPRACYIDGNGDIYFIIEKRGYYYPCDELLRMPYDENKISMESVYKFEPDYMPASSLVKKGNLFYIGLGGGIAIYNSKNDKYDYYFYDK